MALTYTPPGEIGAAMPSIEARGINTDSFELAHNQPTLVMFICNHCPYVMAIEDRLIELGNEFKSRANIVAVCSNDPADYAEDSYENLKLRSEKKAYPFVYLHDESQDLAKNFGAVCTPDFFLFDSNQKLVYRGRLDDSWKSADKVERRELKHALDLTLAGEALPSEQTPSMGCSIKWRES
ncbi:MAG: thioredoxin family protein [Bdellovibrionales bacterium]|nr:thioredoxin family protein [Bdellovibrionales bacterium]